MEDKKEITEETQNQYSIEQLDEGIQHVNNPVVGVQPVEKKYLTAVKEYNQLYNNFYFSDGDARVEVRVVSDEIIRVRMAPHGTFLEDFSYAVPQTEQRATVFSFNETVDAYKVSTNTIACIIYKENFHIAFADNIDTIINEDAIAMHWEENLDYGGYYVYATKKATETEAFYGLGDKTVDLNLRGSRLQNWNSDTYSFAKGQDPLYRSIPFYIGINGETSYGIFFDNTFKTQFDFAHENAGQTSFWADGGELQYYYIHGPKMIDVVKRYHILTGTHQLPPMWALGFHQCRWSYYPESKVKDIARNFRERKIPCDAIYLDIDYMDGYRCFTWNKKYFPDPKRMIKELADDGFKTVVIIDPGIKVDENYWVFREGKEKRYFCRRCDDYFMEGYVWPGRCQFPDFTNPEVREWWGGLFKELAETGVAGVWNDMNEPAVFGTGTFPVDVRHNYDGYRGSHRKAHNVYGMQMVRATYDGLKKQYKSKRPFTITRAGYSGVQRYSSVWTGDNVASWEHLKLGTVQCQRLSMSGISFCGTDIGGFSGEPDAELFTRWIQFGVFSPFMRAHSAGDTREREPWSFGEEYEAINRKFIELRYRLLPYIYSAFWEQHRYGFPILRPVAMLEQADQTNHYRENEFTFGDKILVAPVTEPGQKSKIVYLPKGKWYDYWTHDLIEGGAEITVNTPLDSMPIFVRAGSVIPESPLMQYVGEFEPDEVMFQVYYADYEVNSFCYEDHGDTFAYEQDIYMEKKFVVNGDASSFTIRQSIEGLFTPRYETYDLKIISLPFKPARIVVDNKDYAGSLEEDELKCIRIKVNKNFKYIQVLA
ncbi:glycoside hydrolase family 31 protein [Pedobacter sp. BS3]|uniref:glycoside hydrolase family 31 protein n=1 Tax=Pedobacter sp. BS3 TaxID=2567937 RepID=UPI0011ED7C7C|nr:glycoside hydrolase family 31 protein [Pedobacter sp. BS3]TZF82826.1 glycoside hydrolase family 31 protein [Pedobacter sp. BS3]